ncbi:MAG: DUF3329 domain-containing protein [Pseudomonadota bacterium]
MADLHIPFFRPVWRRVVLVGFCFAWAVYELSGGALFWGAVFAGMGLYAAYQLFVLEWSEQDNPDEPG